MIITHPELMVSYDETELSTDMTGGSKAFSKGSKEKMILAKALGDKGEVQSNKTSQRGTAVCGSWADGYAAIPHVIFNHEPDVGWLEDPPQILLLHPESGKPHELTYRYVCVCVSVKYQHCGAAAERKWRERERARF